jgi:predicted dehydrogenase
MGTTGTAILEESNLIKWQFEQEMSEDKLIINAMSGGNVSHGGVSNPADISFKGHQSQIEDMIHSIETGDKPLIDGVGGRKSVAIVLAIYESARSGKMVRLPGF